MIQLQWNKDYLYVTFSLAKSNQNPRQIKPLCQIVICPAPRHLGRIFYNIHSAFMNADRAFLINLVNHS